MTKLTKAQAAVLRSCLDWSADWEIRDRMGRTTLGGILTVLNRLWRRGMLDFRRANFTYRITEAGLAALKDTPSHV